jgi:lipoprotein-releasing system permease protein
MNFEFFISRRYFLSLQKERFISIIGLISCLGVMIGVMALIVVIAVMTGFDNDLKDKIIGANPCIILHSEEGVGDFAALSRKVRSIKEISDVAPYASGQAFLYYKDKVLSLNIKGIDYRRAALSWGRNWQQSWAWVWAMKLFCRRRSSGSTRRFASVVFFKQGCMIMILI